VAPIQQPSVLTQADIKDRFYRHFQQECTEIQEQIALLGDYSLVGGEKQDAINHVLSGISRLSTEVSDSSGLIPAYDQRIYAQVSSTASATCLILTDSRQLKHLKRNLKRPAPNLRRNQDSSSRQRRRIHLLFLLTMQQSLLQNNVLNLSVPLALAPPMNRRWLLHQHTSCHLPMRLIQRILSGTCRPSLKTTTRK
jgi:hypothetical protein